MDFGQQRLQQQNAARQMMYQNPGYQFERRDRKTLILDVADTVAISPLSHGTEFSVNLFEPLIIDKLSDIYLDSFMTHNSHICHTGDKMAFSLQINEFNVNSNVASSEGGQNIFNSIIIPNEHNNITDVHSCVVHKGKKLNYVCSINPCKLSNISGKITDLNGSSMYGDDATLDGGKLHFVQLTSGATKHVGVGEVFTWSGGTSGNFKTAFAMESGSTDLYFYSSGGTITDHTLLGTVSASGTGINSKISDANTYREGDFSRFIAEFVIVSRD
tara:strand:- start:85 stop:903 length:819 start_codon:yes stop_codon:yes gene_type:complete